ncbi:hypothetical protein CHS0354_025850 [Potamilus streckersoni]|uniref:Uncharacterized protein n=1 Tax=Potamilus streckersoni TaxID=2493646 RepID=A0AAE0VTX2_9BIVA|nr:hypothetical protein CHS0354_025850 [Potamilus streckersoni]
MANCDFVLKVKERFAEFWKLVVPNEEANHTASEEKFCGHLENLIQDLKSIQSSLQLKHERVDTQKSEQSLLQAESMNVDSEVDVTTEDAYMDEITSISNSVNTTLDSSMFDNIKEVLKNKADTLDIYNDNKELIRTAVTDDNVSTCTESVPNKDQYSKQNTLKIENVASEEEKKINSQKNDDGINRSLPQDLNLELSKKSEAKLDPNLVQIRASKSEIERRIAAFIEQKRSEVDEENQREFCSHVPKLEISEDSCARTDAVFYPRAGGKSHIKVSRVINVYGPQTQRFQTSHPETMVAVSSVKTEPHSISEGAEERITNMEVHLKMKNNIPKADMYNRLKSLESRILYLESLSPEYFPSVQPPPKRQRLMKSAFASRNLQPKELSLPDIDERMKAIRQTLLNRTIETSQKIILEIKLAVIVQYAVFNPCSCEALAKIFVQSSGLLRPCSTRSFCAVLWPSQAVLNQKFLCSPLAFSGRAQPEVFVQSSGLLRLCSTRSFWAVLWPSQAVLNQMFLCSPLAFSGRAQPEVFVQSSGLLRQCSTRSFCAVLWPSQDVLNQKFLCSPLAFSGCAQPEVFGQSSGLLRPCSTRCFCAVLWPSQAVLNQKFLCSPLAFSGRAQPEVFVQSFGLLRPCSTRSFCAVLWPSQFMLI